MKRIPVRWFPSAMRGLALCLALSALWATISAGSAWAAGATSLAISGNPVPLTSWRGTARAKVTFTTFGSPGPFSVANGQLLFGADDGEHGRELWAMPVGDLPN